MTASNQWSLFTTFVFFTLSAIVAATINWFGLEVVVVTSFRFCVFLALAIIVRFVLVTFQGLPRRNFPTPQDDLVASRTEPERKLPDVEFVIAAAENGLVSEPESSIRYLDPPVSDRDIAKLTDCAELKWLVLDNTDVSDSGLAFLHGMTKLRRLYVRGSRVTSEGVEQLKKALPNVTVLY